MFKMLSFRLHLMINKKDIQFVHELLDSSSYLLCNHVFIIMIHLQTINVFSWFTYSGIKYSLG